VSTYANLLHGLAFAADIGLKGWQWLVGARPFVLSGVLPLLVVYLSEIAAADVNYAVQQAEKERQKAERRAVREAVNTESTTPETGRYPMPVEQARERRKLAKVEAMNAMLNVYRQNPDASLAEVGRAIGRSKGTVANYLKELEQAGRISRNGDGVVVLVV
jgi:hypothetical protein